MKKFAVLVVFGIAFVWIIARVQTDEPTSNAECLPVQKSKFEGVILENFRTYKITKSAAVRSDDYERFFFVAVEIRAPGKDAMYPMFAMNRINQEFGVIYSVNDAALLVSGLGDGRTTKAEFNRSRHGFSEALACLKAID